MLVKENAGFLRIVTSRAPEITDTNVIELTDQLQQRLHIYINVFSLQMTHH